METYDIAEAAARTGVSVEELARMCEIGILAPDADGRFTAGHLRRAGLVASLVASGIPLEGLAEAIRGGRLSLDFLDAPAFERFSALSGATFAEVAERTGVPVEQLLFVREAAGSAPAAPGDRMRDEELPYADMLEASVPAGFRPGSHQQLIRVQGDSLRAHRRDRVGDLAGRGDRAGDGGRQAARRDPRHRLRRSDERAHASVP